MNALNELKNVLVIHLVMRLVIHLGFWKNETFRLLIHLVIHFPLLFLRLMYEKVVLNVYFWQLF